MSVETTRRGFLRGSVGAAVAGSACSRDRVTERGKGPATLTDEGAHERVRLRTTVNGEPSVHDVHPDDAALRVLRDDLGWTGCKQGCGHGACGACTVRLDDATVTTCILPATALEGRRVTTVEGLGRGERLHPVQRAFMATDALQCGYCTPGFVVEAAAFHDRWRVEHAKGTAPDRDTIAAALSGHLCRCGAYEAIYEAVADACAGRFDGKNPNPPRHEAREKVTGAALYTVDVRLDGMLHAKVLHAPHAHARVTRLDWSRALKMPGVRGAVELLGASRRIRFAGQEVMALAAVDERTAEEALALVDVAYAVEPPLLTLEAARDENSPPVYARRADRRHPINASEGPLLPQPWRGNVRGPMKLFSKQPLVARRAIERARKDGIVAEGRFTTQVQCHTALEPHAAVARWDSDEALTVWMSTQAVSSMAHDIATRWKLRKGDVRVVAKHVGGGFGAKATLTSEVVVAVELARVCGAPVRHALDRRAELMIGGHRPATEIDLSISTDAAGTLTAMRSVAHSDSGVAVGHVVGPILRLIYPDAPRELLDYDVVTHTPAGKPFRGPGGPMAFWALEQLVDEVAHRRGEDPLQMRRRWDPNPARRSLYAWAEALPVWKNRSPRAAADRRRFRRGVGLACAAWFAFVEPRSRVRIDASPEGIVVSTATQDMGNGSRSVIAQTVARELGLSPREVDVDIGDSNHVVGPLAGGSRTTSSIVPACQHACDQLREELLEVAVARLGLRGAKAGRAGVTHADGEVSWRDVVALAAPITVVGRRKRDDGGYFLPPVFDGVAPQKYVSASIQLVEIEVDTRLGRIRVLESWGGFGVGRIVCPTLAVSQARGGIVQGISYALYEERRLDPRHGFLLSAGLEDYRIAGIGDIGAIHVHFGEDGYDKTRARGVGLGELVTLAPAAALGNAVHHATGWRPRDLPLRPDRVLEGVRT